jgi:NADH dehydrogenase [ubiquinone] 1 alpha subcomplex assembly factor 6
VALLLLPAHARKAAFAVRAFNTELAMIRSLVSEKSLGRVRIKFWRETVDHLYNDVSPQLQPVTLALREAINSKKLSKHWFMRLIDARESNLDDRPYLTLKDVEDYAENTASSVLYLTLECLGIRDVHADHAASHLGKAEGIITLLRATPYHAHNKKVFLPMDLLALHLVSQEDVLRGLNSDRLQDVVYDIASQSKMHLNMVRHFWSVDPQFPVPF